MMDFTGEMFGNHRLLEPIGNGGYADVYKGEHIWLGTLVAVKVLNIRVNAQDRAAAHQSLWEALIAHYLRHRHIIPIIDCNIQDGIPYIVMPYIRNGSLAQVYGPYDYMPWSTMIDYVCQVATVLTFIHARNFIHRDVKPGNMLLTDDGIVLLSDFGIVAFLEHTGAHYSQAPIGTISFMAPECFTHGIQTPASDIYSLGIVVYKWLTGFLPYIGTKPQVIYKHQHVPLPTQLLTEMGIEPTIQHVLLKALAKDPNGRYQSALEFYRALKNAKGEADQLQHLHSRRRMRSNGQLF